MAGVRDQCDGAVDEARNGLSGRISEIENYTDGERAIRARVAGIVPMRAQGRTQW